jgi:diguanylate cyclase (GGDEF)-like protein/PAS domain S-box-containing protein
MDDSDDSLVFLPEAQTRDAPRHGVPWLVLLVDDEPEVHNVTQMVLRDFTFQGRPLRFISAFTAAQARDLLRRARNVAVCLLDVVMETNTAGLELVRYIRNDLSDHAMRIILRTGQPGHAPEQDVILRYDINDYKAKTELTRGKLVTSMVTALRSYQQVRELENSRLALADLNRTLEARVAERTRDYRLAEKRLQSILDAVVFPIAITRLGDNMLRYANPCLAALFGVPPAALLGRRGDRVVVDEGEGARLFAILKRDGRVDGAEVRLRVGAEATLWVSISAARMEFEGEACVLCAFHDISERKALETELKRLATTDTLTGTPNRRQFLDLADREFARARRFGTTVCLLIFDIDHFKAVNDTHGHRAGDRVLQGVAEAARRTLREVDVLGRLGGEEFGVVLPGMGPADALLAANRLRRAIGAVDHGVEGLARVTVSVGLTVVGGPAEVGPLEHRAR